jgi:hypothetical protein
MTPPSRRIPPSDRNPNANAVMLNAGETDTVERDVVTRTRGPKMIPNVATTKVAAIETRR